MPKPDYIRPGEPFPRSNKVWLSDDDADAMRYGGWCSYPQCNCIVSTTTTQPIPRCPLGLDDSYVESPERVVFRTLTTPAE